MEIELLSGLANFSAKKLLLQWKLPCLPALLPFTDGIILHFLHDHLSLTHLTAKVFIPQEWSWWGATKLYCHAYYYSL